MKKKVLVVGAGIGGLATAALLAKDNYNVVVVEKNNIIGGRARYLKIKNFTFDMGPSWYMMPEVFENYFSIFNKKTSDFYHLKRLPINYRVFFDDKTNIDIKSNLKDNLITFKKNESEGDIKLKNFLNKSKFIYETAMKELVFEDYQNPLKILRFVVLKNLLKFNLFQSIDKYLKKTFKNEKLIKILEFTTVFLGGSPYNTPAFYQLIAHADFNLGIYYPDGGIYQIVKALKSLCKKYKVKIFTQEEVKKVEIEKGSIKRVITNKKTFFPDLLIINADMAFFESKIIPKQYQSYSRSYWEKKIFSPSAFIIYLGIKDELKMSEHHNLFFTDTWEKNFEAVYNNPNLPTNPSFYWHIPSKTDPTLAPKRCHSVMILVPLSTKIIFNKKNENSFFKQILTKFASLNKIKNIEKKIIIKKIFNKKNFQEDYNSYQGAAFGLAHTLYQTAIFRPINFSKKVKNLYYVGHHTNPGVGMPPVLISSQIVYNLIKKNEKKLCPDC